MGDHRPTARELAFEFTDKHSGVSSFDVEALILRDRAASDAREDRLREALERIAKDWRPKCQPRHGCCDPYTVAHSALAAIPPRSDR